MAGGDLTPRRSAIASRGCEGSFGWATLASSRVSRTGCSKATPVAPCLNWRKRMSNATLWPQARCPARRRGTGSTSAMGGGRAPSRAGCRGWGSRRRDAGRGRRAGRRAPRAQAGVDDAVAPIWMISSPAGGSRPVVSVSNTVKARSARRRSASSRGGSLAGRGRSRRPGAALAAHGPAGVELLAFRRPAAAGSGRTTRAARARARTRTRRRDAPRHRAASAARSRRRRIGSISQLITVSVLIAWPPHTRSRRARPSAARQAQPHRA